MSDNKTTAIIVAAGASSRMGFDKLSYIINKKSVLEMSVNAFANHKMIDEIVIVANVCNENAIKAASKCLKPCVIVNGGATRAQSVMKGISKVHTQYVAIHDAARPFVSERVITDTIMAAKQYGAAAPAVPVKDTIKQIDKDKLVTNTPQRDELYAVQTPQVFDTEQYLQAAKQSDDTVTDDCQIFERAGKSVKIVEGEYANYKITTKEDIKEPPKMRIGHGYDVHKLVENRKLILGGVAVPYELGLLGHSDADVLAHAIMDALLGAAALGDIGKLFPDNDEMYKNADSLVLLKQVTQKISDMGYCISNVDATILCQEPKLRPYIDEMRAKLAQAMDIAINDVSVKATTEEKLGFTGAKLGIAAHAVALITDI